MKEYSRLLDLLNAAIADRSKLATNISDFQNTIWHSSIEYPNETIGEILGTLAYDLDYYVANAEHRAEDVSFFGEDRAIEEIRLALAAIKSQ